MALSPPGGQGGVPERPNGTALKAVTGRNVSRGFKSRPLCLMIYRLDRRFVLQGIGINLLVAAAALSVTAVVSAPWVQVLGGLIALALFVRAVLLWVRPPVVARTDAEGITLGGALTIRPVAITWTDVENVSSDALRMFLDRGESVLAFPLAYAGERAPELLREVYDRLNTAHGYERFELG